MGRSLLMPPNFQELPFWSEFCDAIDSVWADRIDSPQRVFPILRDTYSFGFQNYGDATPSGMFDVNNFFNFSRPAATFETTIAVSGTTFTITPVNTGYPKNLILVYLDVTGIGNAYQFIPMAQYTVVSTTQITFNYTVNAGTKLKVIERIPAVEMTRQLRFLGFQYQDTEFVTRPTYVDNSHVLQLMANNYGAYLKQSKGTANFIDFFGFCFSSIFQLKQLWANNLANPTILPAGDPGIGTEVIYGGTWFPTSYVNLYYDLFLYGDKIDENGIRTFFNYIAPINLVLRDVVLNAVILAQPINYGMRGQMSVSYL